MTDDELLDRLVQAFAPDPVEPPMAGVFDLRRAIGAPPRDGLAWRPRRLTAAAAIVALVLSGSTSAFALTGAPLPRPLRVVAYGVGLPVDSVAVANTRTAADHLHDALARHDPAQVDQAARQLRARLAHLEAGEKRQIGQQTAELLQEANQAGEAGNGQHQDLTGPNSPPPSAPAGPSGSSSGPSGDQPAPRSPGNGRQNGNDAPGSGAGSAESGNANQGAAGSQTPAGALGPVAPAGALGPVAPAASSQQSAAAPGGDLNQPGTSGDTGSR